MCENILPLVAAKGKIKATQRFMSKDVFTALLINHLKLKQL